jgi:uncharacterized protein (DUF58 family)
MRRSRRSPPAAAPSIRAARADVSPDPRAAPSLLEPGFMRELEALRRRLAVRARSGGGGDHLARRRGGNAEFLEHRPYAPGDDLRRIDWHAFARSGEPVFKLFRAEEDVMVRLVVDASASLDAGEPSKLLVAKRLAAGVAYMALAASERAQVLAAGEGLTRAFDPARGSAALPRLLRDLDGIDARGGTDLARAIDAAVTRAARPGLLVVLSDFMDPGPYPTALSRAAAAGHDVVLVQVLSPDEVSPPYDGDYALEDAESGAVVDVTVDEATLRAYLARLDALFEALRALARRHRATYVRATTTEPLLAVLRRLVARAID